MDDVTSHIASSVIKEFPGLEGRSLHVSLLPNPSHLEVVGCVAAGKTRAKIKGGSKAACLQVCDMSYVPCRGLYQLWLPSQSLNLCLIGM